MRWVLGEAERWPTVSVACAALALAAAGCSHPGAGASGQASGPDAAMARMRADITALQVERERLTERLSSLEMAEQRRVQAEQKVPRTAERELLPRLPVVRIGQNGESAPRARSSPTDFESDTLATDASVGSELTSERGHEPPVQGNGASGLARSRRGSSAGEGRARAESSESGPEARRMYDSALALLRAKRFDAALQGFTSFLVRYPDHPSTDVAMYWRGECLVAQGEHARAAEQFEGVLARFPSGSKAPAALLELGLCQRRLGASAEAERTFADLKDRYPNSEAARQSPR